LISDATVLPESLTSLFGGQPGTRYSVASSSGKSSDQDFDLTLGLKWLERYYTVYNVSSGQVSVAPNPFTNFVYVSSQTTSAINSMKGITVKGLENLRGPFEFQFKVVFYLGPS